MLKEMLNSSAYYFIKMRTLILFGIVYFTLTGSMQASHIIGGSIHYELLSTGQYEVTLTLYRDCSSNTEYDDPASIGCFNSAGDLVVNLEIPLDQNLVSSVESETYNACYSAPLGLCVEEAIYVATVSLPPIPGGYTLTYQRCCRNFSIVNVPTGTDVGITLTTDIPGSDVVAENDNPEFATHPPLVICLNAPFTFDHSATDADGDELVYEFCAPLNTNVSGSYINPPGAPPYNGLAYNAGYSATNPIDANPAFQIDPVTGIITGTPTSLGQYVIGVCISEYRDGVLINLTNRDFQLNVTTCAPIDSPAIADQENICSGLSVNFLNQSSEGLTYHWDFGVSGVDTDTSNVYAPSYTYVSAGTYDIMLVLNPGLPCADTTFGQYVSSPALLPAITTTTYSCANDELLFDFIGDGGTDNTTTFAWNFGTASSPQTSSSPSPSDINLGNPGTTVNVTLSISQSGCTETITTPVDIPEQVMASIEPQTTFCDGYFYQFNNLSQNATEYSWDFGLPGAVDLSVLEDPSFTFPDTGYYEVTLIAMAENVCPDTAHTGMLIYGMLQPFFQDQQVACFEGNSFSFTAEGASSDEAIYHWDFGTVGLPQTSSSMNPSNVHFTQAGTYDVSLTIAENDCLETYTSQVTTIQDPNFVANVDTLFTCADGVASFHGNSVYENAVSYLWDFGDGITSTSINPSHQYTEPGSYDIHVAMWTTSGCIAEEEMTFQNVIQIEPLPIAGFTVSDSNLELQSSLVEVESTAGDLMDCSYLISDGTEIDDCDFTHEFSDAGIFTITQQVTSPSGCTASIIGTIIVNGFVFYAPNSFTPDDDGVNDFWIPEVTGVSSYLLMIFNRWGDKIFETQDIKKPWLGEVHDGNYYSQNGVYNYIVIAQDLLGLPHEFSGHITMIR
jgi:gliding motility-associated-like protein